MLEAHSSGSFVVFQTFSDNLHHFTNFSQPHSYSSFSISSSISPFSHQFSSPMKKRIKIIKSDSDEQEPQSKPPPSTFANLDDNLLFEVFKHVDARTLATAAGVSKQWFKTAHDERLWELLCTKHWTNLGCANQQLRSVVLALGGFRRLHSLYPFPPMIGCSPWGKDEVHLSLSLLSIRYYEKMKFKNRPTS